MESVALSPGSCITATETMRFTGKERDAETGLDYFGARYFSGAQGRFTRPDEPLIDQDESDPQSWNLYSYIRNNPLSSTDPTGRKCVQTNNGWAHDGTGGPRGRGSGTAPPLRGSIMPR